jgi:hypothetical protein
MAVPPLEVAVVHAETRKNERSQRHREESRGEAALLLLGLGYTAVKD